MATAFLDHPRPLAFAHRGGAAHHPENSWRAFEHAVGLGYSYLETDLQGTADGVLVAFHDRTLDRVTDRRGRISRMSHAELSGALIGGTEPIPRLEDLLAAWPSHRFNLDVKDVSAIAPLSAVLQRTNAWDRVCIVSFSANRLRATRHALGRPICMATTRLGTAAVWAGARRQRGDTHRPGGSGPARQRGARGVWPLMKWLAHTGIRCVQLPVAIATPSFIERAQGLGLQVHVWTVNARPTMERLLDLGVDGIMTDETVALRDVLTARSQWHPR
jgi:glycerophosphoryl diester phosphodiesterase